MLVVVGIPDNERPGIEDRAAAISPSVEVELAGEIVVLPTVELPRIWE